MTKNIELVYRLFTQIKRVINIIETEGGGDSGYIKNPKRYIDSILDPYSCQKKNNGKIRHTENNIKGRNNVTDLKTT